MDHPYIQRDESPLNESIMVRYQVLDRDHAVAAYVEAWNGKVTWTGMPNGTDALTALNFRTALALADEVAYGQRVLATALRKTGLDATARQVRHRRLRVRCAAE